jgi:hypothetical protein
MSYIAQEVADMQSDIDTLTTQVRSLEHTNSLLTFERDQARAELAEVRAQRDEQLVLATQLRSIVENASMHLVQAVTKIQDSDRRRRIERQAKTEAALDAETGGQTPLFLRKPVAPPLGDRENMPDQRDVRDTRLPPNTMEPEHVESEDLARLESAIRG